MLCRVGSRTLCLDSRAAAKQTYMPHHLTPPRTVLAWVYKQTDMQTDSTGMPAAAAAAADSTAGASPDTTASAGGSDLPNTTPDTSGVENPNHRRDAGLHSAAGNTGAVSTHGHNGNTGAHTTNSEHSDAIHASFSMSMDEKHAFARTLCALPEAEFRTIVQFM